MTSVLVLDDDPGIRRITRLILAQEGYEVREESDAEEALAHLDREHPSLIVLDLQMPGMDGETFYRIAREHGYDQPVLIISAYGAEQARKRLHADAALAKPFDPDSLVSAVSELVGAAA